MQFEFSVGSVCLVKYLIYVWHCSYSEVSIHIISFTSLYFFFYLSLPHSRAPLLCTLVSILSVQRCLHRGTDIDISPLHHCFLLETGRRKESSTKGAGINHLVFVIIIPNRDGRTKPQKYRVH